MDEPETIRNILRNYDLQLQNYWVLAVDRSTDGFPSTGGAISQSKYLSSSSQMYTQASPILR